MHPCEPGGKKPMLSGWPEKATADPATIRAWWRRWPGANVAIATGPESGLLALDVDGTEGERSLIELERRHGPLPDLYPMQWTGGGRGGWQAMFAYPEGRQIGISAEKLGVKLDTRGARGFVLVPPSVTVEAYRWADDRDPRALPPAPAPAWLVELLDPPPAPQPERGAFEAGAYRAGADRYGWRALESELALLVLAGEGRRNDQLNRSAHALFRLVADGRLHRADVDHALAAAARHGGLKDREITATISSAARARGLQR